MRIEKERWDYEKLSFFWYSEIKIVDLYSEECSCRKKLKRDEKNPPYYQTLKSVRCKKHQIKYEKNRKLFQKNKNS